MPTDNRTLRRLLFWLGLPAWLVLIPTSAVLRYEGWEMYESILAACIIVALLGFYRVWERSKKQVPAQSAQLQPWQETLLVVGVLVLLLAIMMDWRVLVLLTGAIGASVVLPQIRTYRQMAVFVGGSAVVMVSAVAFFG